MMFQRPVWDSALTTLPPPTEHEVILPAGMFQDTTMTVMENMGRPPGRPPPGNIDHLYPDPDTDLNVVLLVFNNYPDLDGRHWMIGWQVGSLKDGVHTVWRQLQIVQERGFNHYTNWGPLTKTLDLASTSPAIAQLDICTMSPAQRAQLEEIASTSPVYVPNGSWNCQDWLITVLKQAVEAGLVSGEDCQRCITAARTPGAIFPSDSVTVPTQSVGSFGFLPG